MKEDDLNFFKNLLAERLNDLISHADDTEIGRASCRERV